MSLFFSNMLLGRLPTDVPKGKGRVVSFAGADSDIRLATGTMRERVLGYLYLSGIPSVSRDIATGIKSNPSRVTKTLKDLSDLGEVEAIKHEGCVMEYSLTAKGAEALQRSPVFAELKP
jgi:predicted transcriptional regulator with HTH domain